MRLNISLERLRGQCYDGASAMSGKRGGVAMGGQCYDGASAMSGKEVELLWEVNAMMGPVP